MRDTFRWKIKLKIILKIIQMVVKLHIYINERHFNLKNFHEIVLHIDIKLVN